MSEGPERRTLQVMNPASVVSLERLFTGLQYELEAMMLDGDPALASIFNPSFLEGLEAAYRDGVADAVAELIAVAADVESNGDPDGRLAAHGLTGVQLETKLDLVRRRMVERNAILESVTDGRPPSLLSTAQQKVMEAIDLVLDSFVAALNIGGVVKEYKKMLEHAL